MTTKNSSQNKKIGNYVMMIVLIVLALSIAALILAAGNYVALANPDNSSGDF